MEARRAGSGFRVWDLGFRGLGLGLKGFRGSFKGDYKGSFKGLEKGLGV